MASLLGQKIEPNYRGILNTETLNNPISASLQKITDGQNNFSALSLSTGQVGIAGSVQYDWVSTPTGVASKTTMWFDATGRMSWRPGTGAASFVRTFDATGITADRVYTLPNSSMSLIGTNAAIDTTLRAIVGGGTSPLQLSTTQIGMTFSGVANPITWRANATLTDYSGWHQADGTYRIITKDTAALFINIVNAVNFQSGLGSTGRTVINAAGNWSIGGSFTNAARLHVQGDGTNPIFRAENSTGSVSLQMLNSGALTLNEGNFNVSNGNINVSGKVTSTGGYNNTTSTIIPSFESSVTCSNAAGNANFRPISISYTINNSGAQTGTATGIFLNATETALNGMAHNFITVQRGGVNYFNVTRAGLVEASGLSFSAGGASSGRFLSVTNGVFVMYNSGANDFTRLNFGSQDATRPALQVSGAALEVRTADGANYTQLVAGSYAMSGWAFASLSTRYLIDQDSRGVVFISNVGLKSSNAANDASAILDIASTTKGVLFPRMTTTQVNNIGTPADGLVVYNTTIGHLCVRAAGVWHKLSHSTM